MSVCRCTLGLQGAVEIVKGMCNLTNTYFPLCEPQYYIRGMLPLDRERISTAVILLYGRYL
jgi:hypothetical protein